MDQYASQVIGSEHPWKMGCESKALLGTDGQWEEGGCHQEAAAGGCSQSGVLMAVGTEKEGPANVRPHEHWQEWPF